MKTKYGDDDDDHDVSKTVVTQSILFRYWLRLLYCLQLCINILTAFVVFC